MSRGGAAVVLVFLVIFTIGMPFVLGAAVEESRAIRDTSYEFTPTGGETYEFDESNIDRATYFDNETVYEEGGTEAKEGTDYVWYTSNGTLKVLSGSNLADDNNASIDFSYEGQTKRQSRVTTVLIQTNDIIVPLSLIGAVGLMMAAIVALRGLA